MSINNYLAMLAIVTILNLILSEIDGDDLGGTLGRVFVGALLVTLIAIVTNIFNINLN